MAIDFSKLSEEEKAQIREQVAEDNKRKNEEMSLKKSIYDELKDESVNELFVFLFGLSTQIKEAKTKVFDACNPLLSLKKELYGLTDEDLAKQQSHTFTNSKGDKSVVIGYNVIDGWDDDLITAAKARIEKWLTSKISDSTAMFVSMVKDLLNANNEGKLKASRVMEIANKAREYGETELIAATDMLQQAYRPQKSSSFVKAKYKDDKNTWQWVELSMSQA